jgi:hypothetical protein
VGWTREGETVGSAAAGTDPTAGGGDDLLTLTAVSIRLGVSLDRLRRLAARDPRVGGLCVRVGRIRAVRERDLPRLAEVLG